MCVVFAVLTCFAIPGTVLLIPCVGETRQNVGTTAALWPMLYHTSSDVGNKQQKRDMYLIHGSVGA